MLETTDPNQLNGYDYAGNNPITGSDPSGLWCDGCNDGQGWPSSDGYLPETTDGAGHPEIDLTKSGPIAPKVWDRFKNLGDDDRLKWLDPVPDYHPMRCTGVICAIGAGLFTTGVCELATAGVGSLACAAAGGAAASSAMGENPIVGAATGLAGGIVAEAIAPVVGPLLGKALSVAKSKLGGPVEDAFNGLRNLFNGACGANSFAAGTAVLMADGSHKPIQDVEIGDKITNADPDSTTPQQHTVTAIHVTGTDTDFSSVSVATTAGPKTITVTAHHLFWDSSKHIWTTAADLKPGDQLDTGGTGTAAVLSSWRFTSSARTYNLTVDGLHTYYVLAGAAPVLVHNCPRTLDIGGGSFPDASVRSIVRTPGGAVSVNIDPAHGPTVVARSQQLPFGDSVFDQVSLNHFPQDQLDSDTLSEAARVLKPGGTLSITTGRLANLDDIVGQLRGLGFNVAVGTADGGRVPLIRGVLGS